METIISKVRAEIERLKYVIEPMFLKGYDSYYEGENDGYDRILSFLDTLESERPMNQEELEKEIDRFEDWMETYNQADYPTSFTTRDIARHFAQWGAEHARIDITDFCKPIDPGIAQCIADHSWEMLGEDEKPVPNDLEEAAEEYADKHGFRVPYDGSENFYDNVDVKASKEGFIAGAKWDRQQMMKEAVEGKVFMSFAPGHNQMVMADVDLPTNTKVRIIIVKE